MKEIHKAALKAGYRTAARISAAILRRRTFPRIKTVLWTSVFRRLAWRLDSNDIEMIAQTSFGASLWCRGRDLIQSHILFFGMWEPNIGHFLVRRLHAGDTFVDVGANIGYFSMLAAERVGEAGKVISIEASPSIFRAMKANLGLNHYANIQQINIAVAREAGSVDIFRGPESNSGLTSTLQTRDLPLEATVPASRLTEILGDACAEVKLIKIDIEGAEYEVLMSMLEDIDRYSEGLEIVAEISPSEIVQFGSTASLLIDAFQAAGFNAYGIESTYADYLATRPPVAPRRLREVPSERMDIVFSRIDSDVL